MEDLYERGKEAVRSIRGGVPVEGATLEGDVLTVPWGRFKVEGTERLRLIPIPEDGTPEGAEDLGDPAARAPEAAVVRPAQLVTCSCGREFLRSKFNPYLDRCPECRKPKKAPAEGREFVCKKCGKPFMISKFQPYIKDPDQCPHCRRNARIRARQKRKAAEAREARAALPAKQEQ